MTIHVVDLTEAQWRGRSSLWPERESWRQDRTLCGKPVVPSKEDTPLLATISIDSPTLRQRSRIKHVPSSGNTRPFSMPGDWTERQRVVCKECTQISKMTPDARREATAKIIADAEAKKKAAFEKLQEKAKAKKAIDRASEDLDLERARLDAIACLDAWDSGDRSLLAKVQRCSNIRVTSPGSGRAADTYLITWVRCSPQYPLAAGGIHARCALQLGHGGQCRELAEDEQPMIDLGETLALAIRAHRREHPKSRGARLWQFRRQSKRRALVLQNVICRFCQRTLGQDCSLGHDYSNDTTSTYDARSQCDIEIDVRDHTVRCALRYLAGLELIWEHDPKIETVGFQPEAPQSSECSS